MAAEPAGARAKQVDAGYVLGCRSCGRVLDAMHAPTCPTYGVNRHPEQFARKVEVDECMKWAAAIDPAPRRKKR